MTKINRSLESAFDLTPDVEAYVSGADRTGENAGRKKIKKDVVGSKKKPKSNRRAEALAEKQARVAFSTRISQALLDELCLCMARRKVKFQAPWKQQEIVEKALREWLSRNGG